MEVNNIFQLSTFSFSSKDSSLGQWNTFPGFLSSVFFSRRGRRGLSTPTHCCRGFSPHPGGMNSCETQVRVKVTGQRKITRHCSQFAFIPAILYQLGRSVQAWRTAQWNSRRMSFFPKASLSLVSTGSLNEATTNHCPFAEGLLWCRHCARCLPHFIYNLVTVMSALRVEILTLREATSSSKTAVMALHTDLGLTPFQKGGKRDTSWILKQVYRLRTINIPILQMKEQRFRELSEVPKVIEGLTQRCKNLTLKPLTIIVIICGNVEK